MTCTDTQTDSHSQVRIFLLSKSFDLIIFQVSTYEIIFHFNHFHRKYNPNTCLTQSPASIQIYSMQTLFYFSKSLILSIFHYLGKILHLKVFILPRVAELFIHKEKQRGCPLLGANRYTHI